MPALTSGRLHSRNSYLGQSVVQFFPSLPAALTGGRNVPSARFRVRQYIDCLAGEGVEVTEFPAPWGMYPPSNVMARPAWCMASLFAQLPTVIQSYRYDLTLLQREMLSTFVTLEPFTKRPRILDVDDAIWLHPRGQFAARLASKCEGVLCGNAFLADYFRQWNPNVTIIPTAISWIARTSFAGDQRINSTRLVGIVRNVGIESQTILSLADGTFCNTAANAGSIS